MKHDLTSGDIIGFRHKKLLVRLRKRSCFCLNYLVVFLSWQRLVWARNGRTSLLNITDFFSSNTCLSPHLIKYIQFLSAQTWQEYVLLSHQNCSFFVSTNMGRVVLIWFCRLNHVLTLDINTPSCLVVISSQSLPIPNMKVSSYTCNKTLVVQMGCIWCHHPLVLGKKTLVECRVFFPLKWSLAESRHQLLDSKLNKQHWKL